MAIDCLSFARKIVIECTLYKKNRSVVHLPGNNLYSSAPSAAYMRQWIGSALVQLMACRRLGAKPLSKPVLGYCFLDP